MRFPVLTVLTPQLWSILCILSVQLHSLSSHIKIYRIFEIGRHLWTSNSPFLCSKQSAKAVSPQVLNVSKDGESIAPPGHLWLLAALGTRTHYCSTCCPPRSSHLLCKAAFQLVWGGFFLSRDRTWLFPLLNFLCFLRAHFSRTRRTLWVAAQLSGASASALPWWYLWICWGCVLSLLAVLAPGVHPLGLASIWTLLLVTTLWSWKLS